MDFVEGGELAIDTDGLVAVLILFLENFLHAVIDHFQLQFFHIVGLVALEVEDTLAVEHIVHAAGRAETAAELVEIGTDIGHRAVVVVRGALDQNGDAVRGASLENDFLVIGLILFGGTLDGALDVVLGHILATGRLQQSAKTRVARHIRTAGLDSNRDFLTDFGKGLGHMAPSLEFSFLAELKRSSHRSYYLSILEIYLSMS